MKFQNLQMISAIRINLTQINYLQQSITIIRILLQIFVLLTLKFSPRLLLRHNALDVSLVTIFLKKMMNILVNNAQMISIMIGLGKYFHV